MGDRYSSHYYFTSYSQLRRILSSLKLLFLLLFCTLRSSFLTRLLSHSSSTSFSSLYLRREASTPPTLLASHSLLLSGTVQDTKSGPVRVTKQLRRNRYGSCRPLCVIRNYFYTIYLLTVVLLLPAKLSPRLWFRKVLSGRRHHSTVFPRREVGVWS